MLDFMGLPANPFIVLLIMANEQMFAALYQFEMLEHVHAEQNLVDGHALDNTGPDVVEL